MKAKNIAASVRQRLLNLSKTRNENFQLTLTRYANDRLIYRLSQSPHRAAFVLKGATLFSVWADTPHRATRDVDFLTYGTPDPGRLTKVFREVVAARLDDDDGLDFLADSVRAAPIRENNIYQGVRVQITAKLGAAVIALQIDVGFGDAIHPSPEPVTLPPLLDQPPAILNAYRQETVLAEKLHAIVSLGIANSRMKDYFDLWTLARSFPFKGLEVADAIAATFSRRNTEIPEEPPIGLSDEFARDGSKQSQWTGFVRRAHIPDDVPNLLEAITLISTFLLPPLHSIRANDEFTLRWQPGGPWLEVSK